MTAPPLQAANNKPARIVSLRALLAGEIVVSMMVNVAFNFLFAWLMFPMGAPIPLWGAGGLAMDALPASFVPALMMTFVISAIMRRRLRAGLRVETDAHLPIRLPERLLPRAIVIGLLAIVLVALPAVALLALLWNDSWSWAQLVPFKLAFSVAHAVIVTPIVILSFLRGEGGSGNTV